MQVFRKMLWGDNLTLKTTTVNPPGAMAEAIRSNYSLFASVNPALDAPRVDIERIKSVETNPIAMACVRKIAWNAASVKFGVEFLNGDIDFDHPIAQRIEEPNTEGGRWGLIQLVAASLAVCSRAYVYGLPSAFDDGAPSALVFLRPDHITRMWNTDGTLRCYHYNSGVRGSIELEPSTVCEIKHPWIGDQSGMPGSGTQEAYSQISAAWGAMSLYTGLSGLIRKLLHNNGGLPGLLTWAGPANEELSKDQRKAMREYIEGFRSDGDKFGKIGFLDTAGGKVDFVKITEDFKSMNMEAGKQSALNEMCAVFGVPPLLLTSGQDATFANMAEARRTFWMETVLPGYVNVIAEALSTWLGVRIKPDLAAVPALSEYRLNMATSIAVMDYLTINEKRAMMGHESVLGGDILMLNPAMLPLNRIINSQSGTIADQAQWMESQDKVRELLRTGVMPAVADPNGSKSNVLSLQVEKKKLTRDGQVPERKPRKVKKNKQFAEVIPFPASSTALKVST